MSPSHPTASLSLRHLANKQKNTTARKVPPGGRGYVLCKLNIMKTIFSTSTGVLNAAADDIATGGAPAGGGAQNRPAARPQGRTDEELLALTARAFQAGVAQATPPVAQTATPIVVPGTPATPATPARNGVSNWVWGLIAAVAIILLAVVIIPNIGGEEVVVHHPAPATSAPAVVAQAPQQPSAQPQVESYTLTGWKKTHVDANGVHHDMGIVPTNDRVAQGSWQKEYVSTIPTGKNAITSDMFRRHPELQKIEPHQGHAVLKQ